jgi:ABC-type glutathione transport system ATPase component
VLATRACATRCAACATTEGKCIVFSTHIMQEVERLCDQVVVVAGGRTVAEGTVPSCWRAPARPTSRRPSCSWPSARRRRHPARGKPGAHDARRLAAVFTKELRDALRDRRTLLMVLLSSVAMGPLVLVLLSIAGGRHGKAGRGARRVVAVGMEHGAHAAQLPRAPDLDGARRAGRP